MTWRDQLRDASFRGVAFETEEAPSSGGRRVVVHEYPNRDTAETEDMGRKVRSFSLSGYVISGPGNGMNYMPGRDALEAALDAAGPGRLVHPYRGEMDVVVLDWRLMESSSEGGYARFDIEFLLAAPVSLPAAAPNTQAEAREAIAAAQESSAQQLAETLDTGNDELLDGAASAYEGLVAGLGEAAEDLRDLASRPDALIADVRSRISGVYAGVTQVSVAASNLLSISERAGLALDGLRAIGQLLRLGGRRSSAVTNSAAEAANQQALGLALSSETAIAAAEVAVSIPYVSFDDAIAVRDQLLGRFDDIQLLAGDALYQAMTDLRTAVNDDLNARALPLARVTRLTPADTVPAIVLVQRLYGPAAADERAEALMLRNGLVEDLFVPGGAAIEVLSE